MGGLGWRGAEEYLLKRAKEKVRSGTPRNRHRGTPLTTTQKESIESWLLKIYHPEQAYNSKTETTCKIMKGARQVNIPKRNLPIKRVILPAVGRPKNTAFAGKAVRPPILSDTAPLPNP
jgi:hypothetical protein